MQITIILKSGRQLSINVPAGTTMTSTQLGVLVRQATTGRITGLIIE